MARPPGCAPAIVLRGDDEGGASRSARYGCHASRSGPRSRGRDARSKTMTSILAERGPPPPPGTSERRSSSIERSPGVGPSRSIDLGEALEGRCGVAELAAGSHRLEPGGGLGGLRREGREQAAQLMGRFPQVGRVLPRDGLLHSGQGTRYVVLEDADQLVQEHRIVVAGRQQRLGSTRIPGSVDEASGASDAGRPASTRSMAAKSSAGPMGEDRLGQEVVHAGRQAPLAVFWPATAPSGR